MFLEVNIITLCAHLEMMRCYKIKIHPKEVVEKLSCSQWNVQIFCLYSQIYGVPQGATRRAQILHNVSGDKTDWSIKPELKPQRRFSFPGEVMHKMSVSKGVTTGSSKRKEAGG